MKKRYRSGIGIAATLLLVGMAQFETQAQDASPIVPAATAPSDSVPAPAPVENVAPKATVVEPPKENKSEAIVIKGKLQDEVTKETLIGATINVKDSKNAVTADENGDFSITVKELPVTLVIGYIGYQGKEVEVYDPEIPVEVTLKPKLSISEVVVIGYGTQERKDIVSSVSKIDASETNRQPVASLDAQLQGKATGLQINNNSGVPGDAVFVRVRGTTSINSSNDPLYIVDGVFINNTSLQTISTGGRSTSPIADINPSDIESMVVLKDASATAIYGARGANGVVLITTKRGDYNAKAKITFNVSEGWAKGTRLWKLADGPTNAQAVNDNYIQTQLDNGASYEKALSGRPFRPVAEGGRGNPEEQITEDRLSRVLRTARLREYDLAVQGGTKTTKYYISGAYTNQESILKPAFFERASFKTNLDQKISDKVTVGVSNILSRSLRNQVGAGDGSQGNILSSASLVQGTYNPIYNPDGTPSLAGNRDNVDVLLQDTDIKAISTRYIGNVYADADLLPNLKFRTSWSLDYDHYDEKAYYSDRMLAGSGGGAATVSLSQNTTWINEQTLSYRKKIGTKHSAGILIGNSFQGNGLKNATAKGSNFPSNDYKQISSAAVVSSSETWTGSKLASVFARADYNYAGKYYIEASLRADGSSRFGASHKWGYFPSVGVSWRLKEEDFLKDVKWISELKLRASYGITGNQSGINDFAALGQWTGGASYANNTTSGYTPGTRPLQMANPDLKWEKTTQVNAGIDIGLFKDRLGLEFNVYSKYTRDALLNIPLPTSTGFPFYTANAGEVSNKGFEFGVNTVNIQKKNFTWKTNFSISRNINKVEKLAIPLTYYSRDWLRLEEGQSMYSFWLYKQLYVDPQTGNAVYEDVNGDGQITTADRQILGNAMPKFFGGVTNTFTFKGFDASVLFTYQWGSKIWNHNQFLSMYGGTRADRSLYQNDVDYWKKPGDQTDIPRFTSVGNNWALEQNSRLLEDASFLRLKSLTVGYTVPKRITEKIKLQGLRVYFAGSNLWLLTKYTGPDPESNVSNASQQIQGIDFGTPPQPRTLQIGLNVTL